jgi:hypothetical protein
VVFTLPYLEEGAKFSLYDQKLSWNFQPVQILEQLRSPLPTWQCPSDTTRFMFQTSSDPTNSSSFRDAKGSYGVNWGTLNYGDQFDDQFFTGSSAAFSPLKDKRRAPFDENYGAKLRQIRDGTTKTLAMMELIQAPSEFGQTVDRRARIWNHIEGTYQITTQFTPNHAQTSSDRSACADRPLEKLPCENAPGGGGALYLTSRSRHPGGVIVILCDSSVQFITDGVDQRVWKSYSTEDGGEVVEAP